MPNFKPYKYFLSLTSQFYFCGIPFRLDVKPKCELNCLYCFAMARGGRRTNRYLLADKNSLRKLFDKVDKGKIDSLNAELLYNKMPIHFGGMSDPFDCEESIEVSKEYLKILSEREYPTVISTKNTNAILRKDVFNILKNHKKIIVQISLTSYSLKYTRILEPNVPSSKDRINAIKIIKKENIPIVVRLQPIIINLIDDIKYNLIPALNEAKIDHLITEHLKLPVEKTNSGIQNLLKKTGWNLYDEYKKLGAKLIGREWMLTSEVKLKNINYILENLDKKITHSFADYGLQHLGDTNCCCGIDKFWDDVNWFKGNIVNIVKENVDKNELDLELVEKYYYPSKNILYILNSTCRGKNLFTCKDFIKYKWNSPNTVNAPDHLLGIKYYKIKNRNCIYKKI